MVKLEYQGIPPQVPSRPHTAISRYLAIQKTILQISDTMRLHIICGDFRMGMDNCEPPNNTEDVIQLLKNILEMLESPSVPDPELF